MFSVHDCCLLLLLPALASGAVLLAGGQIRSDRWRSAFGSLALGMGYAIALAAIGGLPTTPPGSGDAWFWNVWFVPGWVALGALDALLRPSFVWRVSIVGAAAWLGIGRLAAPLAMPTGEIDPWITRLLFVVLAAILWFSFAPRAGTRKGSGFAFMIAAIALATGVVMGISQNLKPAEACMSLACIAFIFGVVEWRRPGLTFSRGSTLGFTLSLLALVLFVHLYSYNQPPRVALLFLFGAPLLMGCDEWFAQAVTPRWHAVLRFVLPIATLAAAVVVAVIAQGRDLE